MMKGQILFQHCECMTALNYSIHETQFRFFFGFDWIKYNGHSFITAKYYVKKNNIEYMLNLLRLELKWDMKKKRNRFFSLSKNAIEVDLQPKIFVVNTLKYTWINSICEIELINGHIKVNYLIKPKVCVCMWYVCFPIHLNANGIMGSFHYQFINSIHLTMYRTLSVHSPLI